MRVNWIINPDTDHSKDGTLPYDLAFPFHSLKFNPKLLIPKSKILFHYYFKVYAVVSGSISPYRLLLVFFNWKLIYVITVMELMRSSTEETIIARGSELRRG